MISLTSTFHRRGAFIIIRDGAGLINDSHQRWASIDSLSVLIMSRSQNHQRRCWFSSNTPGSDFKVTVHDNGTSARIKFPSGETSVFHAPWLWSNDPNYVHPTSGQRLRTAASYRGQGIESVQVVSTGTSTHQNHNIQEALHPFPPPPPPGCLHPIGTVFRTTHDNTSNHQQQQWLLKICWEQQTRSNNESSSTETQEAPLESFYDLTWLQQCRYDQAALQQLRSSTKIDAIRQLSCIKDETGPHDHAMMRQVAFQQLFSSENGKDSTPDPNVVFELLDSIVECGAALVTHTPPTTLGESVARVGRALAGGSLSHGALYGDVFHVQSIPDAHNLAYTSVPLQPHQDLAYYESMPGLQLLHCLSNQVRRGGESILIDAMAAAEEFRKLAPNYFDTLVTCPATFIKQREGADMVYRRPHIVLDDQQAVVVAVNWSPPFEGPLSIAPGHVEDYYRAYAAFSYMLDNSLDKRNVYPGLDPTLVTKLCFYAEEHTWERQLQPGEILIFNNRRLLHGRRGFELLPHHDDEKDIVGRHLVGCYTNIDETLNQYRLLLRNRPDRGVRVVRNFGNGSIGTF